MAQLSWEERIKRIEMAPKEMQTMVAKAFLRDDIDDENVQYLFNTDSIEEMNDLDTIIENENAELPEGVGSMGFTMRTSRPCDNLNYIRTGSGGWNTCIKGNPCDPHADVLANCVGYASGRFNEIINEARNTSGCTYKNLNCNAANFDGRASADGLAMGSTPRVGAIICWGGGSEGCGHVGVVERVNSDGTIYTSESGYGSSAIFWNSTRSNANGRYGMNSKYYFKCFIYQPSDVQAWIDGEPTPTPVEGDYFKVVNGPLWLLDDNGGKVRTYPTGTLVKFLNDGYDKYGYHYYHVQVDCDSAIGYMAASYLEKTDKPVPPTPTPTYKFNIGDHVIISGDLYPSSDAAAATGVTGDTETYITRRIDGAAHPYNTTGDLGWMNEDSIKEYVPTPEPVVETLNIGDTVKIIGTGNGSCYGDCNTAYGIGWTRQILNIKKDENGNLRPYPYQVGNWSGTTGFYKAEALEKK